MFRSTRPLAGVLVALALVFACTNPETAKRQAFERGERYFANGQFNEAQVEYRNALKSDAKFGEARWKLAETYDRMRNGRAAFREYVRAADLLPDRPDVQLKAAAYLLVAQRYDDAKTRAEQALKTDPKNVDALVMRANAMAGMKDLDGAIRDVEEALREDPQQSQMYSTLGTLRTLQSRTPDAEAAFNKAIEVSPKSVQPRLALASFYWSEGRLAEAGKALDAARGLDPSNKMVNRMLASFDIVTQRVADAEQPLKVLAADKSDVRAGLALADYYLQTGRPDQATPVLQQLAATKSAYGSVTVRQAQIERLAGRKETARKLLDDLIAKEPRNADAMSLKSSWQRADGDLDAAVATARLAVSADPASARAQYMLGVALAETRKYPEAVAALTETLKLNPQILSAKVLLSRLQLASGNADAAVQSATDAGKSAPSDPDIQMALARSLMAKRELGQAEPIVRQLVSRFPDNPRVTTLHGLLLLGRSDVGAARAEFNRALARDPDDTEALDALLVIDQRNKTLPAAVARIEQRVARNPRNAALLVVAAHTYDAAGQTANEEKTLKALIALQPDDSNAYMMLGRVYARQQHLGEALAQFDAAAHNDASQVGAATMAAMILQAQGKTADAQKRYEAIVAAHSTAIVAANNLAWLYAESGNNLDTALQLAQSAKARAPDAPQVNDTLGWIYYKKGLPQLAIAPFEQSVAKAPNNAAYRLHLGLAYAQTGQAAKAVEALETALRQNPNVEGADLARRTIASLKS